MNRPRTHTMSLAVCEDCDAVHQRTALQPGERAECIQCGAELYRNHRFDLEIMLALAVASLFMLIIANAYPIMNVELNGVSSEATLWKIILMTFDSHVGAIAVIAAVSVFFFPVMQIAFYLYVLLPMQMGVLPPAFAGAMHALRQMQPWSMVEVFVLGALVSVVKLAGVASVTPEAGLWGFAALTCVLTALNSFDLRELWDRAAELGA